MSKQKTLLTIKDLAKIITEHPGCYVEVDNDWWGLYESREAREKNWASGEDYEEVEPIVQSGDIGYTSGGYGSGNCYGGDILQALALLQGITVESV